MVSHSGKVQMTLLDAHVWPCLWTCIGLVALDISHPYSLLAHMREDLFH
jgi:hypothetical protein